MQFAYRMKLGFQVSGKLFNNHLPELDEKFGALLV